MCRGEVDDVIIMFEHVELNLVNSRDNFSILQQILQVIFLEVAHTDGPQNTLCMVVLQNRPCVCAVAKAWGVNEQQIDVVSSKLQQVCFNEFLHQEAAGHLC